MPDYVVSSRAAADGTATVHIQHNKSGIVWVVSQLSVQDVPSSSVGQCTVKRNGQLMTTTSIVPATAGGQPFYRLNAGDDLECAFTNLTPSANAIVTASYSETQWGQYNDGAVI